MYDSTISFFLLSNETVFLCPVHIPHLYNVSQNYHSEMNNVSYCVNTVKSLSVNLTHYDTPSDLGKIRQAEILSDLKP